MHAIDDHHVALLRRDASRLFTENRMNGEEMRDMAQRLRAIAERAIPIPDDLKSEPRAFDASPLGAAKTVEELRQNILLECGNIPNSPAASHYLLALAALETAAHHFKLAHYATSHPAATSKP